ncbi:MAG: efflux RND transporter periplasmic adaptor subunit [Planctomycetes bacterium]|nr:efflux RND transporter periplasmic adaptor subunit [Planctomycetota bacterium]
MKSSGIWVQAAFLAVVVGAAVAYFYFAYGTPNGKALVTGQEARKVEKAPAPVRVAAVSRGDVTREIALVGTVEPEFRLQVIAEVPGRATAVHVEEGERVAEGKPLAEVERDLLDLQVEQARIALEMAEISTRKTVLEAQRNQAKAGLDAAEAGLSQVRTNKANLERERDRLRTLREGGAVSQSQLDTLETSFASLKDQEALAGAQVSQAKSALALLDAQMEELANARKAQAEGALKQATLQLEKATVKAPREGFVNRRIVERGDMVGPSRPLFEIVGIDRVKVVVDLPETVFGRLEEGKTRAEVSADALPGKPPFVGILSRLGVSLNPMSRSLPAEILIANADRALRPGMSARVRILPEARAGVLRIPLPAMVDEGGSRFVFVLQGRTSVKKVQVETGLSSSAEIEVLSGLAEGDWVVVKGNEGLADGNPVIVLEK